MRCRYQLQVPPQRAALLLGAPEMRERLDDLRLAEELPELPRALLERLELLRAALQPVLQHTLLRGVVRSRTCCLTDALARSARSHILSYPHVPHDLPLLLRIAARVRRRPEALAVEGFLKQKCARTVGLQAELNDGCACMQGSQRERTAFKRRAASLAAPGSSIRLICHE